MFNTFYLLGTKHSSFVLFPPCASDLSVVTISRLEAVYRSLVTGLHDKTFTQVKMEATKEDLSLGLQKCADQDVPYQGASSSPMEASPADEATQIDADPRIQTGSSSKTASVQKGRRRRLYTVAQLVVEPDSQGSSQCTPPSEEVEPVVRTEELPPAVIAPSGAEPQSPEIERKFDAPSRIRYGSRRYISKLKVSLNRQLHFISNNRRLQHSADSKGLEWQLKRPCLFNKKRVPWMCVHGAAVL